MSDLFPLVSFLLYLYQGVRHSPNGHLFAVFSDTEYSIYRSQSFKNAGLGLGTDLVWSSSGDYAVREAFSIKVFSATNNQLICELKTDFIVEQLFGGPLLAARGPDFIVFYDWTTIKIIRRIDSPPRKLYWNDTGTLLALSSNDDLYIISFKPDQLA
jgi:coatomer subunit beta'